LKIELKKAQRQKSKINKELARFEEHKDLIKENEMLEEKKSDLKDEKKEISDDIRKFNNKAIVLLAEDILEKIFLDVEDKDFAKIKPKTKNKIVENIFKEMECICGTNFERESEEYKKLEKWKEEEGEMFDNKISEFRDCLIKAREYISNNKEKGRQLLSDFSTVEENIEEINSKVERLESKLDNVPDEEFSSKREYKDELIKKINDLERDREDLKEKLEKVNENITDKEKKQREKRKEKNIKNEYIKKLELTKNTLNELEKIKLDFIEDIKADLEKEATKIFKEIIDVNTKKAFKKIEVNEDYSLEIIGWNDKPFLANISAGQRQIMSLAFITALAKIAGGNDTLEIPLFMDTPFGRLSGAHRDNLL
jgi:DNA sulfur modification protein DndD